MPLTLYRMMRVYASSIPRACFAAAFLAGGDRNQSMGRLPSCWRSSLETEFETMTTLATPNQDTRSGGREARRRARMSRSPSGLHRPYIVRGIPAYDVMSEENLLRIEATADRILAEIGIEFRDDPVALDHWKRAGAKVEGVLVKFEPGMLREILKTAPAVFTQHARNPANSVQIGGKN